MKPSVAALALVAGVLAIAGCGREREQYYNSRSTAAADHSKGALHIAHADGTQRPLWAAYYDQQQLTNFRIPPAFFSLPINPYAAEAWAKGYNEVARPEIERRFGANVLARTEADVQARYANATKQNKP